MTQNVSRPATGIKVVVQTGDLMISVPIRHFHWMPRLTTSRKLSIKRVFGGMACHPSFSLINVERSQKMKYTKEEKKEFIRKDILDAAEIYQRELAGKVFMFIHNDEWFEVVFKTDRFLHLTGVSTQLTAQDFYDKAQQKKLTDKQFDITPTLYKRARKKLPCLKRLPELTTNLVCVVKDLTTVTLTYKIGLTNLDFTLGLTENTDVNGNKINDWFLPRTLRTKDNAIDISSNAHFIDFVLEKGASEDKYHKIAFNCGNKKLPPVVYPFVDKELFSQNQVLEYIQDPPA